MPAPADANVYIDDKLDTMCNCPMKTDPDADKRRKLSEHAPRCQFVRRSVQWLGWPSVDAIVNAT